MTRFILDKHLEDVYDVEGYTTSEVLCQFHKKITELIEEINRLDINVEEFKKVVSQKLEYLLNEGLTLEVSENIKEMYVDGRLETIINEKVFADLIKRVEILERKINTNLNLPSCY